MKTRERARETPTTGLSVASSVRMVLTRLIALFDLRRLSIPRNGKFVLSGLNRSKPEIIFPGKSAWFSGLVPPAHLSRGTRPVRGPWDQASAGVEVGVLENLSFEWYNMKPGGGVQQMSQKTQNTITGTYARKTHSSIFRAARRGGAGRCARPLCRLSSKSDCAFSRKRRRRVNVATKHKAS